MKQNIIHIIGVVVLLFAGLAYVGNYTQWSSATQVTAEILTAKRQWVRRGGNSVYLDIKYPVGSGTMNGTVHLMDSDLEIERKDGKIDVYYMSKNPERVIPVSVLKGKQQAVPFIAAIGLGLAAFGYFLRLKRRAAVSPVP